MEILNVAAKEKFVNYILRLPTDEIGPCWVSFATHLYKMIRGMQEYVRIPAGFFSPPVYN